MHKAVERGNPSYGFMYIFITCLSKKAKVKYEEFRNEPTKVTLIHITAIILDEHQDSTISFGLQKCKYYFQPICKI